ncbi:MAG TPA: type IV pilus secretin PilQ [Terriglobales bacterium]|jgi:type IV pilus assembly protein PilQ
MRKQLVTVFILLLISSVIAAAETGNATGKRATLQRVNVVQASGGTSVEVTAQGQVAPSVTTLDNPARIVLDLPGAALATSQSRILVDRDGIKDVRVGVDGLVPPTSRIVVDLSEPCTYELVPGAGNRIALHLHTAAQTAAMKAPVAPVSATVVPAPQVKATVTAANNAPVAKLADASASNFVVVEPSYKPKQDEPAKQAAANPADRAAVAATRFVEKPDADLLLAASATQAENTAPQPAVNLAAEQRAKMQAQPEKTGAHYTGEPISVNLKDVDLKDFFRLIHEISGLNVVLDPQVKGTLTIVLDDVPWDQALDIVLKNNDLARQLEGNVLRIATVATLRKEAEDRRAQEEAESLAVSKVTVTRFLSYAHSKDVVPTLKKFLTQRGDVISDDRTNALIISDIPSVIPGIDNLIRQLDRKTQEVEIEARVVAATRSFARDIGTQFGFGFGNAATAIGGASSVGTSPVGTFGLAPFYPVVGTSAPSASTLSQIPLFSNLASTSPTSGLTFMNRSASVQVDAIITMAESRGLLKVLSRPRVVTQNNISAVVKQGVRVPIVTQAQLGGPPTVTYVDAFLRLTVIPQITSEGTIFLNVDVENTTPDFSHAIQGNPELLTQQATTQVLVTDGGTVVIGGVVQTQNSTQVDQVPLLGNIPYLGNLFKHTQVTTSNQELIFFITPRVIQT